MLSTYYMDYSVCCCYYGIMYLPIIMETSIYPRDWQYVSIVHMLLSICPIISYYYVSTYY